MRALPDWRPPDASAIAESRLLSSSATPWLVAHGKSLAANGFGEIAALTSSRIYNEQKPARPSFPSAPPSDYSPHLPEAKTLPFTEYYDDETVWLRHAPPGPCYEALVINIEIALMKFVGHKYPPGTVRLWFDMGCYLDANNNNH